MIKLIFQKGLILIKQIYQKNCHYWYILNKNFSNGPYLCSGCYNITQKSNEFKNIAIIHVKKSANRVYFLYMSKCEAKKLMNNSNLIDKKSILIFYT